ncbi:MAG: DUF3761 domain-containing protein [Solirubrobacteraceae bacterium]
MKRLAVILFTLIALVGVLSSHGNSHKADNASPGSTTAVAGPTKSAPHHAVTHVHYTACDQNISAGPNTTCGFADNVFRAFAHEAAHGSQEASVTATSPATAKAYTVRCATTHGVTVCTGGYDARVRFPLWAAKVYYRPANPENEPSASPPTESEESTPESSARSEEPGEPGSECTNGTYENSSGNVVCKPEESSTVPVGATARCADGTYSFSEHRSGTCSYHGGVAEWLSE